MKKRSVFGCMGILLLSASVAACGSDNDNPSPELGTAGYVWGTDGGLKSVDHLLFGEDGKEDADGAVIGNGDAQLVFKGNQTLKRGKYRLKGWLYVADGSTLTIEPGTVVKGDKETKAAIIVERGGKLIAKGTKTEPIVFTSGQAKGQRRPGDWGGIILCGKANNNGQEIQIEGGPRTKHGGCDDADNSGALEYVRIEFAGYPFAKDKEINGLTLVSVGSGTTIDHVQVSYSNDDSFEWFGGTVNCKYLISYRGWDDDFDTDNGFSGHVQFALAVRDGRIADASDSNGFESDNNASGTKTAEPHTSALFSNVTFIGPKLTAGFQNDKAFINAEGMNPNNGSALGKFQAAMHLRRDTHLSVYNSVAAGWPVGLLLDNEKGDTQRAAGKGLLKVNRIYMADMDNMGCDANSLWKDELVTKYGKPVVTDPSKVSFSHTFFLSSANGNKYFDRFDQLMLDVATWQPMAGSPLLGAATFDGLFGFDKVSYIGAFAQNDTWAQGWTNFDPENTDY